MTSPRRALLLVLAAVWVQQSLGYGSGAPNTACNNMTPRHGSITTQQSQPPYAVTALQNDVEPGGLVTVRLTSLQGDFRGFFIQAHDSGSLGPVGNFVNAPANTKTVTCSPRIQNGMTHSDQSPKNVLELTWQAPPNYQGSIQFKCTFLRDYGTFWAQVPAPSVVRVGRSVAVTPDFQTPTTYNRDQSTYPYSPPATTTRIVSTTPSFSTSQWGFPTQAPPLAAPQQPAVYSGCGNIKGCFGLPASCIQQANCQALVTYALKGQWYEFELWAPDIGPNSYVAVALSDDNRMGSDSVTDCSLVNGRASAFVSYNDGKSNRRLTDASRGLNVMEARFSDGNLYCKYRYSQAAFTVNDKTFDLSQKNYLLLARGPATDSGIGFHVSKTASDRAVSFAEFGLVGASSGILIKLHGAFMVAAWMFAASCGILFARYFRLTWVGKQFLGKDLWFVFHRTLMTLTWLLTVIAFILIFVELDGWTSLPATTNPHAVIGVITTILAFIQPFMAYFRPHPGTPKRFIFNWAHWLVGNSAHILAIVCIFLAVGLTKAAIPNWVNWLLVTYVAIHAFSHLILSLAQCCYHADGSRKATAVFAMRDLAPHQSNQNHFYSTQQDKKEDAHGSKFRQIVLCFYVLLVVSFSAAVIGTIVTGPWTNK